MTYQARTSRKAFDDVTKRVAGRVGEELRDVQAEVLADNCRMVRDRLDQDRGSID